MFKASCFLVACILAVPANGDLVFLPAVNIQSGSQVVADANGTGIDLEFSFTGDITTDGSLSYAGSNIGGFGNTRFGWEGIVNSGVFQTQTSALRIDALNGTFGGIIGFEKNAGNASDILWIESDGVFAPGINWTVVGNRIELNPASFANFMSGDPGNGFNPSVVDATYLEFTADSFLKFAGAYDQQFDFNLTATTAIPEPKAYVLMIGMMAAVWYGRRRKRD